MIFHGNLAGHPESADLFELVLSLLLHIVGFAVVVELFGIIVLLVDMHDNMVPDRFCIAGGEPDNEPFTIRPDHAGVIPLGVRLVGHIVDREIRIVENPTLCHIGDLFRGFQHGQVNVNFTVG